MQMARGGQNILSKQLVLKVPQLKLNCTQGLQYSCIFKQHYRDQTGIGWLYRLERHQLTDNSFGR